MTQNAAAVSIVRPDHATTSLPPMRATGMDIESALATLARVEEFAEKLAQSDFIPQCHRGKPGNIIAAIFMGQSVGLGPLQALQGIAVINGKPALYGDALLAVVRAHPDFEDMTERVEKDPNKEEGTRAVCVVKRRGQSPVERTFSMAQAKLAGLTTKKGPWTEYPARMLQMRARGFALRDAFADALMGMVSAEEAEDMTPPEPRDVTPEGERVRIRRPAPAPAVDATADKTTAQQSPPVTTSNDSGPQPSSRGPGADAIHAFALRCGLNDVQRKQAVAKVTGRDSSASVTHERWPAVQAAMMELAVELGVSQVSDDEPPEDALHDVGGDHDGDDDRGGAS